VLVLALLLSLLLSLHLLLELLQACLELGAVAMLLRAVDLCVT
jgi:hypothetical protein